MKIFGFPWYGSAGSLTPIQERQLGLVYSAAFGLSALAGDVIELASDGLVKVPAGAPAEG